MDRIFCFVKAVLLLGGILFLHVCPAQENYLFKEKEKLFFGVDVMRGLINLEPGIAFAYRVNDNLLVGGYYGHTFSSFNIIENGGSGAGYKYHSGTGEIVKLDVKLCNEIGDKSDVLYTSYSLMYKHIYIPKYCNRDGSNGLSSTVRKIVSEDRDILKMLVNKGGIRFFLDRFYFEWYIGGGLSVRSRIIDKYSAGTNNSCDTYIYPVPKQEHRIRFSPAIDGGIRFGFTSAGFKR